MNAIEACAPQARNTLSLNAIRARISVF